MWCREGYHELIHPDIYAERLMLFDFMPLTFSTAGEAIEKAEEICENWDWSIGIWNP